MLPRLLEVLLGALALALVFALGFLMGAGRGMDMVRQQAVDEGFGVRAPDGGFHWKTVAEMERKPAPRSVKDRDRMEAE